MTQYFFQLSRLIFIFFRYSLSDLFHQLPVIRRITFLRWLNPWYITANRKISRGKRLRLALQQSGPIFIKVGQILSTRHDALPEDITYELAKLRDQVSPVSTKKIVRIIEKTFKKNIGEIFDDFSIEPLASASIAQVHSAVIENQQQVVVKILRPNIQKKIQRDISLLENGARLLEKFWGHGKGLKPYEMVNEIKTTLLEEINLQHEASHAGKLREFSQSINQCHIPKIYWDYCHDKVIVMERISGVPIQDDEKLLAYGVDLSKLAETCINVFFTQIFRDRYFHADLHPGNIFIDIRRPEAPTIELVDFGIVGTLSEKDQRYIALNMVAIVNRNYMEVARLHQVCGWIPDHVPLEAFALAMQKVCDPSLDKPLKDISMGEMLLNLIQTGRRFQINIQPQLLLMQKTLFNIEGLCRRLDPNLNFWSVGKPIIERWLSGQVGPKAFVKKIREHLPELISKAPEFPELLCKALNNTNYADEKSRPVVFTENSHREKYLLGLILVMTISLLINTNFHYANTWLNNLLLILSMVLIMLVIIK